MYEPQSLPAWGAWIEMMSEFEQNRRQKESLPAWGAWIEILFPPFSITTGVSSLPAWGAWIEMPPHSQKTCIGIVAPRMGSVDRNVFGKRMSILLSRSLPAWGAWIEI